MPLEQSTDAWQEKLTRAVDEQQFYLNELQDALVELEKNQVEHSLKLANNQFHCSELKKQLNIIQGRFNDWLSEAQKIYSHLTYERVNQLILVPKKDYEIISSEDLLPNLHSDE